MNAPIDSSFVVEQVDSIARVIEERLDESNRFAMLGEDLADVVRPVMGLGKVTATTVVRLALLADCVRLALSAIRADGRVSDSEFSYIVPLARTAARSLAQLRAVYSDYEQLADGQIQDFLSLYGSDKQLFGGGCPRSEWRGLAICRLLSKETQDGTFLEKYHGVLLRLVDDIFAQGNGSPEEATKRDRLLAAIAERALPTQHLTLEAPTAEKRLASAFCRSDLTDVFHAIEHFSQITERDDFDVVEVHANAREVFERTVERMAMGHPLGSGRILLVQGESGSGKTHLMRAFRSYIHSTGLGYAGYMQMSAKTESYASYALSKFVESLDKPYYSPEVTDSSLLYLSEALVSRCLSAADLKNLRESDLDNDKLGRLVSELADRVISEPVCNGIDIDFVRAILYLQRRDPPVRSRVLKYLRANHLNVYDRESLGDIAPVTGDDGAFHLFQQFGRVISASQSGVLVLLVDQLEDIFTMEDGNERFRKAMDVVRHITDHVPNSIVVVACLEDYYTQVKTTLTKSLLDRIERDPEPVLLSARRTQDEVEKIVEKRLAYLYEEAGVSQSGANPAFPFSSSMLGARANQRTRDVLEWCRSYREACIAAGQLVKEARPESMLPPPPPAAPDLAQLWDGFAAAFEGDVPDAEEDLAGLLAWAIPVALREVKPNANVVVRVDGRMVHLLANKVAGVKSTLIGLCNKSPQGGGLGAEVEEVVSKADLSELRPALLRSSEYPNSPRTKITALLADVIKKDGLKIVAEDSQWRTMLAYQAFLTAHKELDGFDDWRATAHPLSSLGALRAIIDFELVGRSDDHEAVPPSTAQVQPSAAPAQLSAAQVQLSAAQVQLSAAQVQSLKPSPVPVVSSNPLSQLDGARLGDERALVNPQPVTLAKEVMKRHVAVLGSSGSGKTTLALNALEQLLLQDIPVLLVDRKGDLASYADPAFWTSAIKDPQLAARRDALRDKVEVALYTPGHPEGRPLSIPVVPRSISTLPLHDLNQCAKQAASGLASMMTYGESQADRAKLGILTKAIALLARVSPDREPSLEDLIQLIDDEDPSLVNEVGKLNPKNFTQLVEHLETLRLNDGELIGSAGEPLSAQELFRTPEGKPKLSIISTKFLGNARRTDFWISRLAMELSSWASANPSPTLQAVAMFDEADMYIPASSKPASKEPMMDLFKRARSGGLGIMIATQSPGDLDYKCRDNILTWYVGRITQQTALAKMKPLLSDTRINVAEKLPTARAGEFFCITENKVVEFRASRSAMDTKQLPEDEILRLAKKSDG